MVTLLDELGQAGVVFRSATEQFERDTIIDRVIAGMERKAVKGKWKGGRRPFGVLNVARLPLSGQWT